MAHSSADLQSFRQAFPLLDIDSTMGSLNQFSELNMEYYSALNYQSFLPFSSIKDSLENLPIFIHNSNQSLLSVPQPIFSAKTEETQEICKKRKSLGILQSSSWNSSMSSSLSPQVYETGNKRRNNSGRGKGAKSSEKEVEKSKEVVHVRARKGQATDSHSLAERVRRGKINEKLRCLQDIVPGCYKTMGMAVMLDEIINYVQSLQNQVEFLSMKLTAASTYCDSESNAMERMQVLPWLRRENAQEAKELERLMREAGYVGGLACSQSHSSSTWSSLN